MFKRKKYKSFIFLMLISLVFTIISPQANLIVSAEETNTQHNGLRADFYTMSTPGAFDFAEKKATVVSPNINFEDLNPSLQSVAGQDENVSIRWTGLIEPEYTEDYTFYMVGDNGFRLWVDNQLIIDHWVNDWDNPQISEQITLEAGKQYDIKIEYFEDHGGAHLKLEWASSSQEREVVPNENLYLPEGYTYDGPLSATVSESGTTVEMKFDKAFNEVPNDAVNHFSALGNKRVKSASLKNGDSSTLVLELEYPITSKDSNFILLSYDGEGQIISEENTELSAFSTNVVNNSTYLITSPWADEVTADNVLPEYPRPQMVRKDWLNLNGEWEFSAASDKDPLPTGQTLDESILVPFAVESKLSGVERLEDHMWYKRNFTIPEGWNGDDVLLHFGAVDWRAIVYVNGVEVGSHKGGFDAFSFNITDHLVKGENELIVEVYDSTSGNQSKGKQSLNPGGIWYTSVSGIWQTVWVEPVYQAHISNLKMTPEINEEYLSLSVDASENNGEIVEAIAYKDGEEVGRATGKIGEEFQVPVPDPRLWSTTDPYLYDLTVQLKNGDSIVDEVSSYFGMREITKGMVDGTLRPLLNGEFVFQMGPLDQGYWPAGLFTAPTDEALKFDIVQAKELGFNMIRKHAKVEPQRFHYWADKLGMLVWQDMPSWDNRNPSQELAAQFEHEFEEIIHEHYNSPSLILWTVFNEAWGQYDTERITNWVEGLDPTRLASNASGWDDYNVGDVIDFHCYVGPCSPEPTDDRIAVLGEYGGLGLHVPGNEWNMNVFNYEMQNSKEQLTDRYLGLIDRIIQHKEEDGLSAAVYTQITDVEIEINGLLSYDRKVEKADFEKLRKAHRKLIGIVGPSDLQNVINKAQEVVGSAEVGEEPGKYSQDSVDALVAAITGAETIVEKKDVTTEELKQAIKSLEDAIVQFKDQINPPIAGGVTVDHFNSDILEENWTIVNELADRWSLTDVPGKLSIKTIAGDSFESDNKLKNIFLRDVSSKDFEITTKVTAPIRQNHQQAGLFIWEDVDNYVRLGHVWDTNGSKGYSIETAKEENASYSKATNMVAHPKTDTMYLKMKKIGNQVTTYYWDGQDWIQAADPVTVSLENIQVGFYATSTYASDIIAEFDYFTVQELLNVTELEGLIEEAKTITNEDESYTKSSFASLQDAIAEAESALETIKTEAALKAALSALQAAIDGLEEISEPEPIDVTELEKLIDEAKEVSNKEGTYTEESFTSLQAAIAEAESVLEKIETEEELSAALSTLQAAIDGLKANEQDPDKEQPNNDSDQDQDENKNKNKDKDKDEAKEKSKDNKLPETATSLYTVLLTGSLMLMLGSLYFVVARRRKQS